MFVKIECKTWSGDNGESVTLEGPREDVERLLALSWALVEGGPIAEAVRPEGADEDFPQEEE